MPRVAAVLNPARRYAAASADLLRAACAARDWPEPLVLTTTVEQPGGPQARRALGSGADVVIAGGGDGTVREVAQVLAGTGVPMGIVPLGTANLFARNLRLPLRRPRAAVRRALGGPPRAVDLGRVALTTVTGAVPERVFLVLVGIGYDAETVALTRQSLKGRIGWIAYLEPGIPRLTQPLLPLTLTYGAGPPREVAAWSVLVGNCGRIPLGIQVLPRARVDDGLLDLVVVAPRSLRGWVPIAAKGLARLPGEVAGLQHDQLDAVRVDSAQPRTVQLDGDPVAGVRSMQVRVDPRALLVNGAAQSPS